MALAGLTSQQARRAASSGSRERAAAASPARFRGKMFVDALLLIDRLGAQFTQHEEPAGLNATGKRRCALTYSKRASAPFVNCNVPEAGIWSVSR